MVSMAQIENGLCKFVDNELAPKIPADGQNGGLRRLGFLVGLTYMIHKQMPSVLVTVGAVDENGNVDIDGLMLAVKKFMPEDGLRVQVPVVSELVFYPNDVEQIKSYIIGGK